MINETPEKIYISSNSQDGTYYINNQYKRLIEYTRTDAFIEKAADKLKQLMHDQHLFEGRLHQDVIIENFVEYFKNYIKGK